MIEDKVIAWLNEKKYTLHQVDADGANVYRAVISNSHPVIVIFPDQFDDLVIIQAGVNIDGQHRKLLESITDQAEKNRIFAEFNYEIMSNTNVGSQKRIEDNIITGVKFESELYLDGITKTNFFQQIVYVRSAALKFISYVNKEL